MARDVLVGIFVGGASSRMGGAPKGLLRPPSGEASIVLRLAGLAERLGVPWVLVGRQAAYAAAGDALEDDPSGAGPLGGLHALAKHATTRYVVALACDMPRVTLVLLARLVDAPHAPIVAPKRGEIWEPLFARYEVTTVRRAAPPRIAARDLGLQALLRDEGAAELSLSSVEARELDDWDSPEDVRDDPRES